ncbi:MAG: tetratricopeptide repeat protein, partial [Moraxellaceae bacterium]
MNEEYNEANEDKELIRRYEEKLENGYGFFFDLDEYEVIIDHYTANIEYGKALEACDAAIDQYPFSTGLLLDKAQVLAMTGDFDTALKLIERVEMMDPTNIDVLLTRGIIFTQQGEYENAVDCLKQASDSPAEEGIDEIYFNLALAYQSWGKFKKAIYYYKKCLEKNHHHEAALQELVYCLEITGGLEASIPFYQDFIDNDPYSYAAWYNKGVILSRLSRFQEAVEAFEYATLIKPDFASAYFNLANACIHTGNYRAAIEAFQESLKYEAPTAETFCNLGECYEKLAQYDIAHKYYQKSIDLNPLMDEAWFGIGLILHAQEKWF